MRVMTFIFDMLIGMVGYTTARLTLPLLSFGRMYVEPIESTHMGFNVLGYRRDESGRIEIEQTVAGGVGVAICVVVCVVVALFIRTLA